MSYRRMTIVSGFVAAGLAAVAALALRRLPPGAELPTHWNAAGEADGFSAAGTALFLPVVLTVGMALLFGTILPRLEPMQDRLDRSRVLLVTVWAGLLALMAVVEAITAGLAFGVKLSSSLVLVAVGCLLIAVGNALPKSRPGFFVGIRTPWAILDEDNWVATHRLGAWTFILGGASIALAGVIPARAEVVEVLVIGGVLVAAVPPLIYSWWLWRARARTM